jgi:PadR family transcriptional regulator, regulatory protein PadR
MEHHDLLSGLVRLHILNHAAHHPVYGQQMIDEMARHGPRLSPGTRYPMLSKLARDRCLASRTEREGRTSRKFHTITDKGREGLAVARVRLRGTEGQGRGAMTDTTEPGEAGQRARNAGRGLHRLPQAPPDLLRRADRAPWLFPRWSWSRGGSG